MKKLAILVIPVLFVMCQNSSQSSKNLGVKNDSLQRLVIEKDSAIYAFMNTFNSIESNLQSIKEKEKIITLNATGSENNGKNQINEDIQFIYNLMLENKAKVKKLEQQLKKAGVSNKNLQATISNLQIKLQEKDAEILQLRNQLKDLNIKVDEMGYAIDTLKFINQARQMVIDNQDKDLHTAYYLFGSAKELKKAKIIDKKGIFSGGKKINKNFDKELFTEIDIREETYFPINAKKIKILSVHPEKSYTLVGEKPIEGIDISNPDEFWSISKYLVVIIYK